MQGGVSWSRSGDCIAVWCPNKSKKVEILNMKNGKTNIFQLEDVIGNGGVDWSNSGEYVIV